MPLLVEPESTHKNSIFESCAKTRRPKVPRALIITAALVAILLGGCTGTKSGDPNNPTLTVRQTQQWAQSCALCHVSGVGGAPIVGDAEQWQPRLEQGPEQLLTNTLEGYANMPPLGYCMSCEVEDFQAMIAWMSRVNP